MTNTLRSTMLRAVTLFTIASMMFATAASAADPTSVQLLSSSQDASDTGVTLSLYYDPDEGTNTAADDADNDMLIKFPDIDTTHNDVWCGTDSGTVSVSSTTVGPGGESLSPPTDATTASAVCNQDTSTGNGDEIFFTDIQLASGVNGFTINGGTSTINNSTSTDSFTVTIGVCAQVSATLCESNYIENRGIVMDFVSDSALDLSATIADNFDVTITTTDCTWTDMTITNVYGCDGSVQLDTNVPYTISISAEAATMDSASLSTDIDAVANDADITAGTEAFGVTVEGGESISSQLYLVNGLDNDGGILSTSTNCVEAGDTTAVGDYSALATTNKTLDTSATAPTAQVDIDFCVSAAIGTFTSQADDYAASTTVVATGKY